MTTPEDPTANGLAVELLDPRDCEAPGGWDEFVDKGSLPRNWAWPVVRALAETRRGRQFAATVRDGVDVVALVAFDRSAAGVVQVKAPGSSALPGLAFAHGNDGELGAARLDLTLATEVVDSVEAAIRRRHRRTVAVWYRQVYADLLPAVMRGTAVTHPGWPVAYFRNEYADYDAYLASLPKSRRTDQRRLVRRIDEDHEVAVGWAAADGPATEAMHRLVDDTARRHHTSRLRKPPGQPRQVVDALFRDPDAMVLRYQRGDSLIGWGLTMGHPANPVSSVWGALEPGDGGRNGLWFDQTARVLQWVIGTGRQGIIGGKGLVDLKCRLGYRPVQQWSVARRPTR